MFYFKNRTAFLLAGSVVFVEFSFAWGAAMVIEYGTVPATPARVTAIDDSKSPFLSIYPQVEDHPLVTWATLAGFPCEKPDVDEQVGRVMKLCKKKNPVPAITGKWDGVDLKSASLSRPEKKNFRVPEFIKKLDGVSMAVVGYMIPLEAGEGEPETTSFMLIKSRMTCCYGVVPRMNEWMYVQMEDGKTADAVMDVPVTVFGVLSVREEKPGHSQSSLYRMVSDRVIVPRLKY